MSEPYIRISDQEEDWKPVIKNFISACALQELIEIKKVKPLLYRRHEINGLTGKLELKEGFGASETRIVLGEEGRKLGYTDVKTLFNNWFNKADVFHIHENPYKQEKQNDF